MSYRPGFYRTLATGFAAAFFVAQSSACAHRVSLQAPSPNAPLNDRIKAFKNLQSEHMTSTTSYSNYLSTSMYDLHLGDGEIVVHPGDLLPVVPPNSATAKAARSYEKPHRRDRIFGWTATGVGVAGSGLLIGGFFAKENSTRTALMITGLALGLANIPFRIAAWASRRKASRAAKSAFLQYNDDLLEYLQLEVDYEREQIGPSSDSTLETVYFSPTPKALASMKQWAVQPPHSPYLHWQSQRNGPKDSPPLPYPTKLAKNAKPSLLQMRVHP